MKKSIEFSAALTQAIQYEVQAYDAEPGTEEIVGDNLSGKAREEFDKLIEDFGFDAVTSAVKKKFHL